METLPYIPTAITSVYNGVSKNVNILGSTVANP